MSSFDRRTLLRAAPAAALFAAFPALAEPMRDITYLADFDELWRTVGDGYCYFADKKLDWNRVRALYRPQAAAAETREQFFDVVWRVLGELYDAHSHLTDAPDGVPRWPLYDILGERSGGAVRIAALSEDSAAMKAGLAIGDRILAVDGVEIEAAVKARAPRCLSAPDPAADAYAINVAVAGIRGKGRTMRIERAGVAAREVALPLAQGADKPDLEWRRLANGMGCITIRSFADPDMVAAFDAALLALRDAPALLIDMRANGGGNTAVARPIMGRFITERKAYARMRRREGAGLSEAWTEYVDPRGPFTYHGPVAVLVSHWSASMAEGFPMGMRDIGRGLVVGTPMMGLGAAVLPIRLDRTGITAQYSGEPVYDTQDRPRSDLKPDVAVADGGDILAAAVAALVQHGRVRPSSR